MLKPEASGPAYPLTWAISGLKTLMAIGGLKIQLVCVSLLLT